MTETVRVVLESIRNLEVAFLLFGDPPTQSRPAHIFDVQPLDSFSTAVEVIVPPEATLVAYEALSRRNPGRGQVLGVSHCHPSSFKPRYSPTDQSWHGTCLDTYEPIVAYLAPGGGVEEQLVPHHVLFQIIFPQDGDFFRATAYLIARVADPAVPVEHFEVEISHEFPEAEAARARVASLAPQVASDAGFDPVAITFGGDPAPPASAGGCP